MLPPISKCSNWNKKKKKTSNIHRGRLNLPISSEIAAVFVDVDGAPPNNLDICIYPRHTAEQNQHRIGFLSPNSDPLTYPLLFPLGEPGIKKFF